jgi:alkylation response protein AidB-like acyl-CoA dehydrogenase
MMTSTTATSDAVSDLQSEVDAIVGQSAAARAHVAALSGEIDRSGVSSPGMQIAWDVGVQRLSLPRQYGGLWDGTRTFELEAFAKIGIDYAAGEGSTGQGVQGTMIHLRNFFSPQHRPFADEVYDTIGTAFAGPTEQRFVASGNAIGITDNAGIRIAKVPGGVHINGATAFNSQSNGDGWIQVIGRILDDNGAPAGLGTAVVALNAPGVTPHNDWDNMGQRATGSGTITFTDVFAPDGWHGPFDIKHVFGQELTALQGLLAGILTQGMGEGALDAEIRFVTDNNRPTWGKAASPSEDPLLQRRLGEHYSRLAASRAALLTVAQRIENADDTTDFVAVERDAIAARMASGEAALFVASDLFSSTGARSTANKHALGQYWRNIRTIHTHAPNEDTAYIMIGNSLLTGTSPSEHLLSLLANAF